MLMHTTTTDALFAAPKVGRAHGKIPVYGIGPRTRAAAMCHLERIQDVLNVIEFDDAPAEQKLDRIRKILTEGVTQ